MSPTLDPARYKRLDGLWSRCAVLGFASLVLSVVTWLLLAGQLSDASSGLRPDVSPFSAVVLLAGSILFTAVAAGLGTAAIVVRALLVLNDDAV